jgi:phosphate:Na+ symporter
MVQLGVPYVVWIERISGADVTRQIANAHTGFNIINTVLMFPLVGMLVFLARKLIPGEENLFDEKRLKFLDKRILNGHTSRWINKK